ncbi:hypothetical protein G7W60_20140 [Pseudomonas fluorescens]|uniref:hypothetical protein n=1 Tax=Pseudomonas fluorescens TaxID=294 RepID=UPI00140537C3|nr:hypothetical protein [Pseudomonas fluorescens]NHN70155.1 hypothetical protein [Pseudomonas fluorescens]
MTASLPAARTVDLSVEGSKLSHPTHDGPPPVLGAGLSLFLEALMKNRLAMYRALKAINVPEQQIEAVIQAMDSHVHLSSAGKSDPDIAQFRAELSRVEVSLLMNIGVMLFVAMAILFAAVAFIR